MSLMNEYYDLSGVISLLLSNKYRTAIAVKIYKNHLLSTITIRYSFTNSAGHVSFEEDYPEDIKSIDEVLKPETHARISLLM